MTTHRKKRKITTNEALEQLLGKKAAKRLRQLALAASRAESRSEKKRKRNAKKKAPG